MRDIHLILEDLSTVNSYLLGEWGLEYQSSLYLTFDDIIWSEYHPLKSISKYKRAYGAVKEDIFSIDIKGGFKEDLEVSIINMFYKDNHYVIKMTYNQNMQIKWLKL